MGSLTSRLEVQLPSIRDQETALRVSRRGFVAAILEVATALMFAWISRKTSTYAGVSTWAYLIAAMIFGAIAVGIWRMSRVAAVAGLVLFLVSAIWMFLDVRSLRDVVVSLAIALFVGLLFVNGVRGTFAYRKLAGANGSASLASSAEDEKQAV